MTPRTFARCAGLAFVVVMLAAQPLYAQSLNDPPTLTWRFHAPRKGVWPPKGARRVEPDSMWVAEYRAAETCLGWDGNVAKVEWFLVPGDDFPDVTGLRVIGLWEPPHRIYLAENKRGVAWLVRHESLHDILGVGGHPTGIFRTLCRATWGAIGTP